MELRTGTIAFTSEPAHYTAALWAWFPETERASGSVPRFLNVWMREGGRGEGAFGVAKSEGRGQDWAKIKILRALHPRTFYFSLFQGTALSFSGKRSFKLLVANKQNHSFLKRCRSRPQQSKWRISILWEIEWSFFLMPIENERTMSWKVRKSDFNKKGKSVIILRDFVETGRTS